MCNKEQGCYQPNQEINQCDGCMQNAPIKEGRLHTGEDGKAFMVCQAYRYKTQQAWDSHTLYTDKDKDRPDVICDRNGQVVLALCKVCNRGESELDNPCSQAKALDK